MAKKEKYFSIPNLVAGTLITPEFIQPDFRRLCPVILKLLKNQTTRTKMKDELIRTKPRLGPGGANTRIAAHILKLVHRR